jgi:hypothetical protein
LKEARPDLPRRKVGLQAFGSFPFSHHESLFFDDFISGIALPSDQDHQTPMMTGIKAIRTVRLVGKFENIHN